MVMIYVVANDMLTKQALDWKLQKKSTFSDAFNQPLNRLSLSLLVSMKTPSVKISKGAFLGVTREI